MKHADLQTLAAEIKRAQDQCRQIEPFTARLPDLDITEAYSVAQRVHEMRIEEGAVPLGRKIGFTNPDMWPVYGVHAPMWGHCYDRTVSRVGSAVGRCSIGQFAEPKIEPEIVLHFHAAPPVSDEPADILACVDWIAHGFEIVQSHFPGWKFQAPDTIVDSGLHGALLVGEPRTVKDLGSTLLSDLENFTITLSCDGEVMESGRGSNVLGSPLKAVAHLIAVLAQTPGAKPVQADELLTTGTLTAARSISAGQKWTTSIEGIALTGMDVSFEA